MYAGERLRCPQCRRSSLAPLCVRGWSQVDERGLRKVVCRSRRRTWDARDFGMWMLIDAAAFLAMGWALGLVFVR